MTGCALVAKLCFTWPEAPQNGLHVDEDLTQQVSTGVALGEGDPDLAHTDADLRGDARPLLKTARQGIDARGVQARA